MPFITESSQVTSIPDHHSQNAFVSDCPSRPQRLLQSILSKVSYTSTTPAFEKLYPIMARLPDVESQETWEDKQQRFADAYLRPTPRDYIPGTLPYDEAFANVKYTRSRLPQIDEASRQLWIALHQLHPLTSNYAGNFQCRASTHKRTPSKSKASCPMSQISTSSLDLVRRVFNWDELSLPIETEASFYGVIFRSKRAPNSEDETEGLMSADKLSHEEAVAHGGLLMYWYGVPDPETGSNLATCIWRSRDEARAASALPLHRLATRHAARAYEDFELSRYRVVKMSGTTDIFIEQWED